MKVDQDGDNLDSLRVALAASPPGAIGGLLQALNPAQLADLLESLPPAKRLPVWKVLDAPIRGEVLVEARREVRTQLIAASTPAELTAAVQRLDLDELSDIDELLPSEVFDAVLRSMDDQRRARFEMVRAYPDDTAGGLMDVDAISVRPDITLATVLSFLALTRAEHGGLPEGLDAVNVIDADGRYLGLLRLADLVSLGVEHKVQDVMNTKLEPIKVNASADRVARRFADEDLMSAPVVDAEGKLLGRITVDDVLDQVRIQGEHSALGAVGLDEGTDTFSPVLPSARRRALWLGINLANALVAAAVIAMFDQTIERLVALAVLMPVVSSMGGVAGTQSLALVIRALALDQVNRANRWRLLRRELGVAVINGFLWATVVGLLAWLWFGQTGLALIFGAAIVLNLVAGVAAGTLIPLLLVRLKVDAAIAGEVLLVAFTDTFGFFIFLGMAALFLSQL